MPSVGKGGARETHWLHREKHESADAGSEDLGVRTGLELWPTPDLPVAGNSPTLSDHGAAALKDLQPCQS